MTSADRFERHLALWGTRRLPAARAIALTVAVALWPAAPALAQVSTRLAIVLAEHRRAATAADLLTLRNGARSREADTARLAIRALGRLNRSSVIPDLLAALRYPVPEARAEAADALAQATRTLQTPPSGLTGLTAITNALIGRLADEADPTVRAAIAESIARLPYKEASDIRRAADAILGLATRASTAGDRLGAAKALEALIRLHFAPPKSADADIVAMLVRLAERNSPGQLSLRDERVRRLALQGLINAGPVPESVIARAATDPDAQVRRLAMTAATNTPQSSLSLLYEGALDSAPMVRIGALRGLNRRESDGGCDAALRSVSDADMAVALVALDLLATCAHSPLAVAYLERTVGEQRDLAIERGWHRPAHALVALATAAPDRATAALPVYAAATIWQVRQYAARAATSLNDRETLTRLAADPDDNVREVAIAGLRQRVGHDADAIYLSQLGRHGNQVVRAAALALENTPNREAVPALRATLDRLIKERSDNSHDARAALVRTLSGLGERVSDAAPTIAPPDASLTAANLRRLSSPTARITIKDVGRIDIALFTAQAPATVLRFARLAEEGYYKGLSFHRVVANFVIQGGSPGANEYVGDAPFMRDELGLWPHVRGTVGVSTRGRDTGDAQIFIDLVDNPRLDHEYTVFGQVLNGADVVDRILEGDIIEAIDIVP